MTPEQELKRLEQVPGVQADGVELSHQVVLLQRTVADLQRRVMATEKFIETFEPVYKQMNADLDAHEARLEKQAARLVQIDALLASQPR